MLTPAGGNAVANWLEKNFIKVIENYWTNGKNPGEKGSLSQCLSCIPEHTRQLSCRWHLHPLPYTRLAHGFTSDCALAAASAGAAAEVGIREAFVQADKRLLQPQGGFLGMGERGVGGSKCGASAAIMIIYR